MYITTQPTHSTNRTKILKWKIIRYEIAETIPIQIAKSWLHSHYQKKKLYQKLRKNNNVSKLRWGSKILTKKTQNNNNKIKSIASFGTLSYRGKFAAQLYYFSVNVNNQKKNRKYFHQKLLSLSLIIYCNFQHMKNLFLNKQIPPYDSIVKSENTREKITTKNQKIFFMSPASVSLNV